MHHQSSNRYSTRTPLHSAPRQPRTIHRCLSPEMARQAEIAYAAVLEVLG